MLDPHYIIQKPGGARAPFAPQTITGQYLGKSEWALTSTNQTRKPAWGYNYRWNEPRLGLGGPGLNFYLQYISSGLGKARAWFWKARPSFFLGSNPGSKVKIGLNLARIPGMTKIIPNFFFCCHCPLMSPCKNLLRLVVVSTHNFEKLGLVWARIWKLKLGLGSKKLGSFHLYPLLKCVGSMGILFPCNILVFTYNISSANHVITLVIRNSQ